MDLAPNSTNFMEHVKGYSENSSFVELVEITQIFHPLHIPLHLFFPIAPTAPFLLPDAAPVLLLFRSRHWSPALQATTASGSPAICRDGGIDSSTSASSVFHLESTQKKP